MFFKAARSIGASEDGYLAGEPLFSMERLPEPWTTRLSTASIEYPLRHDHFCLPHLLSGSMLCPISARSPVHFWWPKAQLRGPFFVIVLISKNLVFRGRRKCQLRPGASYAPHHASWLTDMFLVRRLLSCSPCLGASSILPRLRP